MIPYDVAKELVQFITANMTRESAFLTPVPSITMEDPYGLLEIIANKSGVGPEVIDAWMVEAQTKGKRRC